MIHGWLLKVRVEACLFSTIILALVILKLGILRIIYIYIIKFIFNNN